MISFELVSKSFKQQKVLDQVSLIIERGEFVSLIGESGVGKSTFINLLLGALTPSKGRILVNGQDLQEFSENALALYRRGLGAVFQDFKLLPRKTVFENVAFALEVCGAAPGFIDTRVQEVLEIVGLTAKAQALPAEISGGECSRVGIARALVHEPALVLADEPTGNLDPETSKTIIQLLQKINEAGATVVLATHDLINVQRLQKRVIKLKQGRIASDLVAISQC